MNDKWETHGVPAMNRVMFTLNDTLDSLRVALNSGNAVDSLLILQYIQKAAELKNDIQSFVNAKQD